MAMPLDAPPQGAALLPSSKAQQRTTLLGVSALHALHDGMADGLSVLLPLLSQSFGLSYAQAAALRTMFHGALSLLQLPAGILAERIDGRWVLAAGTVIAGVCFALLSVVPGYVLLLIMAAIAGAGSAVQHPIAATLISQATDADRRRSSLGIYNAAGDIGKMGGAWVIAAMAAAASWQSGTLAYGLAVAAAGVLAFVLFRRLPHRKAQVTSAAAASLATSGSGLGLRDARGFWLLSTINVLEGACRYGFTTFLPFLLTGKGAEIGTVGLALLLLFAGGAIGKFVCGFIAERFGILRTIVVTEIATGALVLAVVSAPLDLAMAVLLPLGMVLNGTSSVIYGSVSDFVHEDRQSRAFGFFYTLSALAGALAPLAFGVLSDLSSVEIALIVAGCMALATLPFAGLLGPHLPQRKT